MEVIELWVEIKMEEENASEGGMENDFSEIKWAMVDEKRVFRGGEGIFEWKLEFEWKVVDFFWN